MRPITNRVFERAFEIPLPSIKRYALLLLGRNPEADQAGGVQRYYRRNEAFMVYLMAVMVKDFRMKLDVAKQHIIKTWRELEEAGILPSQIWEKEAAEVPDIDLWIFNPGLYELRNYIERKEGEPEWITVPRAPGEIEIGRRTEVYDYRQFPLNPPKLTGEIYILQLKYHLLRFRHGLKTLL
jgi:hypothetical protein